MGVLQRFEKRLENLVEGAFARVFKGVVHPVEIASAMQREADAHKSILGGGRVLVPNRYIIDLSPADHDTLAQYAAPLAQELAQTQAEFIGEQGWMVYGDVIVEIERGDGLDTGMFRIAAEVYTGGMDSQPPAGWQQQAQQQNYGMPPQQQAPTSGGPGGYGQDPYAQPDPYGAPSSGAGAGDPYRVPADPYGMPPENPYGQSDPYGMPQDPGLGANPSMPSSMPGPNVPPMPGQPTAPVPGLGGDPYGQDPYGQGPVSSNPVAPVQPMQGSRQARLISADGRQFAVAVGATIIGRGEGAQVRLADVGISRQHARLDFDGGRVVLTDLGSTNGTTVNGNRINAATLQHGDVIQLGTTTLTFRLDG